jgi:hypothetical protein
MGQPLSTVVNPGLLFVTVLHKLPALVLRYTSDSSTPMLLCTSDASRAPMSFAIFLGAGTTALE